MSEPCPHLEIIAQDDMRFERGYYQSGRERADLITTIQQLRARVSDLEQRQRFGEIAALRAVMTYARHRPGCGAEQRPELRCQCGFARALSDAVRLAWVGNERGSV